MRVFECLPACVGKARSWVRSVGACGGLPGATLALAGRSGTHLRKAQAFHFQVDLSERDHDDGIRLYSRHISLLNGNSTAMACEEAVYDTERREADRWIALFQGGVATVICHSATIL